MIVSGLPDDIKIYIYYLSSNLFHSKGNKFRNLRDGLQRFGYKYTDVMVSIIIKGNHTKEFDSIVRIFELDTTDIPAILFSTENIRNYLKSNLTKDKIPHVLVKKGFFESKITESKEILSEFLLELHNIITNSEKDEILKKINDFIKSKRVRLIVKKGFDEVRKHISVP